MNIIDIDKLHAITEKPEKEQANYSITKVVKEDFQSACDEQGKTYSEIIEGLMVLYVQSVKAKKKEKDG